MEAQPASCGTTMSPPLDNGAPRAYCNFQGVSCDHANQRVVALNLTGSGLAFNMLPVDVGNLTALTELRKCPFWHLSASYRLLDHCRAVQQCLRV
jgi:hypothetical protein